MILINYGTNEYFLDSVWDKYYCRSFISAKKELTRIMKSDNIEQKDISEIISQYETHLSIKRQNPEWINSANLELKYIDLYIYIEDITLI